MNTVPWSEERPLVQGADRYGRVVELDVITSVFADKPEYKLRVGHESVALDHLDPGLVKALQASLRRAS